MLLSSHMEGFFEELVEDVLDAFDSQIATPAGMPSAIRIRQVLGDASRWATTDIDQRWHLVRNASGSPLFEDEAEHAPGQLDVALHTDGFSNPGSSEIRRLFKSIGIDDCWVEFHAIEPRNSYRSEIDAIVSRRNQIAHGDMNSTVTDLDIGAYINNFKHTADVFAQLVRNYIASHLPGFTW